MQYLLILIYSGLAIEAQPRSDLQMCFEEARARIGEELKVVAWDNMNGSNPIPKVAYAFCAPGVTAK